MVFELHSNTKCGAKHESLEFLKKNNHFVENENSIAELIAIVISSWIVYRIPKIDTSPYHWNSKNYFFMSQLILVARKLKSTIIKFITTRTLWRPMNTFLNDDFDWSFNYPRDHFVISWLTAVMNYFNRSKRLAANFSCYHHFNYLEHKIFKFLFFLNYF